MYTRFLNRVLLGLALPVSAVLLSACSSDSPFDTTAGSTDITDPDGNVSVVRIGSTVNSSFADGVVMVSPATLSANGTAVVSVEIVDAAGAPSTSRVTVAFSSPCATAGSAGFSNPTFLVTNGTATTNYVANGCLGQDDITATITGTVLTASGSVTIVSATAGTIQATSVSNQLIALAGTGSTTGLPESSTVTFTVKNGSDIPLSGEVVNFTLNNVAGGISLASATATSNSEGVVSAIVQSGSIATSVRVTATLASNPALTTTSSAISIATGPPDQDSMTISAFQLNPRSWNVNGKETYITASLADRFNNPITDGTAISFTTELGAIGPSCTTVNGSCSVIWRSQQPRTNTLSTPGPAGITTILATVEGEESFVDVDADGVFSDGDTFDDLAEAFRDDNANGVYDSGEFFVDFNSNGIRDPANGLYNGKGCQHSTLCDTQVDAVTVRGSTEMVMTEDNIAVTGLFYGPNTGVVDHDNPPVFNTKTDTYAQVTIGGAVNNNILPVGSVITFSASNGKVTGGEKYEVPHAVATARTYTVAISDDDTPSQDGVITADIEINDVEESDTGSVTEKIVIEYSVVLFAVNDEPDTYTVSGSVTGIPGGETLILKNNDKKATQSSVTLNGDGPFTFPVPVFDGQDYEVKVELDPANATCVVSLGTGIISGSNVSDVVVNCAP